MFRIEIHRKVSKFLEALNEKLRNRCMLSIDFLLANPFVRRPQCDIKKMSGKEHAYRLRVGDCRFTYLIDGDIIQIEDAFWRGRGYRD